MRTTMIDLGRERGPLGMHNITTATSVDCNSKEVGLRRSLRSLIDCIVPACCGAGFEPRHSDQDSHFSPVSSSSSSSSFSSDTDSPSSSSFSSSSIISRSLSSSCTTLKGTFFGQRNGRVSFCLQEDYNYHRRTPSRRMTNTTTLSSFTHPLLLLEFAVPTSYLAKEMQHGLLRIALVEQDSISQRQKPTTNGIFEVPVWSMYCNGRKVGYATRRKTTPADSATLTRMQSVSAGAGVLPPENNNGTADGIMYLRASFTRIIGSPNSESFHMINPEQDGRSFSNSHTGGQELSIFLLRSSS